MEIEEQAIKHFGEDHQILKLTEEIFELGKCIMHLRKTDSWKENQELTNDVLSEMVDVYLVINQFRLQNELSFSRLYQQKLKKLEILLQGGK